jgi:hypothetical protein
MSEVVFVRDVFFEPNLDGQDAPTLFVELNVVDTAQLVSLRTDYLLSDDLRT